MFLFSLVWIFYVRYGLIWISTTLVFVLASLGNCATYLMDKHTDKTSSWSFNVGYVNSAACVVYGYAAVVPLAFYFLLQYMGSYADLVRFWCMWGYSLFIFVLASVSTFLLLFCPSHFVFHPFLSYWNLLDVWDTKGKKIRDWEGTNLFIQICCFLWNFEFCCAFNFLAKIW